MHQVRTNNKEKEIEIKVQSTWNLTEEGVRVFAESSHRGVDTGLSVTSRQLRSRVVATLIVVVLDI